MDPAAPQPRIQVRTGALSAWDDLLERCPDPEFTATSTWTELVARHVAAAESLYLLAELDGSVVGGLSAVTRIRRGIRRLESSLEGTLAGPQVIADVAPDQRAAVAVALYRALADRLGGRSILAAVTVPAGSDGDPGGALLGGRWQRQDYDSAVVDCRGGLDHVGHDLWTNNRRNERNRGLKRGCTLQVEHDPEALADWYPLYLAGSDQWAQAPVPLALLQDLLTSTKHGVFNTVRHEGALIAGHMCFRSRGRLVAWQGAVRPDVHRTLFPTTLVYWQDIILACEEGLAGVDFGGCVGRDSLWDFKRRCGARPTPRCQLIARSSLGRLMQGAADRWRGRPR